ncbi:MAG: hypothetical protein NTW21_05940 [Verrucomicrobia bacterium]|nr:hypothetical protein [Verrucomicrobiota bacterium]
MIVRFATYEEASIYAGMMQADGHFAAVLDESMGFIYGPLAIGGFRVLVTEEPVAETEEPPGDGPLESAVLNFLRLLVTALVVLCLAIGLGVYCRFGGEFAIPGLLVLAVLSGAWLGICLVLGPLMGPFTRALRDEQSPFGWLVKAGVALLFVGQYVITVVFLLYALGTAVVGWLFHG